MPARWRPRHPLRDAAPPAAHAFPLPILLIALLGAESTGKTELSHALAQRLRARGHRVAVVPEALRTWCEQAAGLPSPEQALAIAQQQERQVDEAARTHDIVIADAPSLMVALHAGLMQPRQGLLPDALARLRGAYGLTLLMGLDLPWVGDGLHRANAQARQAQDAMLRQALAEGGIDWRVVYGRGAARADSALSAVAAVAPWVGTEAPSAEDLGRWQRLRADCEKCGDARCEHRLFRDRIEGAKKTDP